MWDMCVWAMSQSVFGGVHVSVLHSGFEVSLLNFPNFQSFSPDIRNSKRSSLKELKPLEMSSGNDCELCAYVCERHTERGNKVKRSPLVSNTSASGTVHGDMMMYSFDKDAC